MQDNTSEPCIGCGFCCIDSPCGLGHDDPCEHLHWAETRYLCDQFPFDHALSHKTDVHRAIVLLWLGPNRGCNSLDKHRHLAEARSRHTPQKGGSIC